MVLSDVILQVSRLLRVELDSELHLPRLIWKREWEGLDLGSAILYEPVKTEASNIVTPILQGGKMRHNATYLYEENKYYSLLFFYFSCQLCSPIEVRFIMKMRISR